MRINQKIYQILLSDVYKWSIQKIAKNYFNLKQEFWFRNLLLEQLNEDFEKNEDNTLKAIAEHPRIKGNRVDLSIIDKNNLEAPYLIEFKYQYSGDLSQHKRTRELIEQDYNLRGSDMFVLVILDFIPKNKINIDKIWGIEKGISKFISKSGNWIKNLEKSISKYHKTDEVKEINHIFLIEEIEYRYKIIIISKKNEPINEYLQ